MTAHKLIFTLQIGRRKEIELKLNFGRKQNIKKTREEVGEKREGKGQTGNFAQGARLATKTKSAPIYPLFSPSTPLRSQGWHCSEAGRWVGFHWPKDGTGNSLNT